MLVVVRIAWVVLLLSLVVLVAALLTKHLIKEAAKLGVDQSQKRKKSNDIAHFELLKHKFLKSKDVEARQLSLCDAVHILIDKIDD